MTPQDEMRAAYLAEAEKIVKELSDAIECGSPIVLFTSVSMPDGSEKILMHSFGPPEFIEAAAREFMATIQNRYHGNDKLN